MWSASCFRFSCFIYEDAIDILFPGICCPLVFMKSRLCVIILGQPVLSLGALSFPVRAVGREAHRGAPTAVDMDPGKSVSGC